MNLEETALTIADIWNKNPKQAFMLLGPPGCGKTYCATITVPSMVDIHPEAISMFRPSLKDPTDVGGLPMRGTVEYDDEVLDVTDHLPIKSWVRLNKAVAKHGRGLLVIDELNQSTPMMFNALNGIILDYLAGDFVLDPRVSIICTGNRQSDKAASNRMPGHTAGRLLFLDVESSLDGYIKYGEGYGYPLWLLAFLKFRPKYVNAYSPDHLQNPTERTWQMVVDSLPDTMPKHRYREAMKGLVGEAATVEAISFKDMYMDLPDPAQILADPERHPVPPSDKLSQMFAIATALSHIVSKATMDAFVRYTERLPKDFFIMAMSDAKRLHPEVCETKAYRDYLLKHGSVLIGA